MTEKKAAIRVGTSGYSFEDWRGEFYPETIQKGKMLDHYVKFFPTVEINSTYYRIPHPAVMANIVKKAPPQFDFMVKVPQSFTHRRTNLDKDAVAFKEALKPFEESGKLSGLLAQFPYSFKYSADGLDYIAICRNAVAPNPLFVEFRHTGWVNRDMYDRLKAEKIGYVCVDEPQLPGLLKPDLFTTTETAYLRLHGRNSAKWWDGGPLRYDYSYSEEELNRWKEKLMKITDKVKSIYVFFNNCHRGQAVNNAREFMHMLNLPEAS
ncbi:MAG: DUF72 domain-containing protein [Candidatus Zixiibacteriota bacterium]|nr:MAG: DUF72 domain-containing protein [candidate division Zixibacteria bacterium]